MARDHCLCGLVDIRKGAMILAAVRIIIPIFMIVLFKFLKAEFNIEVVHEETLWHLLLIIFLTVSSSIFVFCAVKSSSSRLMIPVVAISLFYAVWNSVDFLFSSCALLFPGTFVEDFYRAYVETFHPFVFDVIFHCSKEEALHCTAAFSAIKDFTTGFYLGWSFLINFDCYRSLRQMEDGFSRLTDPIDDRQRPPEDTLQQRPPYAQ